MLNSGIIDFITSTAWLFFIILGRISSVWITDNWTRLPNYANHSICVICTWQLMRLNVFFLICWMSKYRLFLRNSRYFLSYVPHDRHLFYLYQTIVPSWRPTYWSILIWLSELPPSNVIWRYSILTS